jgi:hypothetical protein
MAKLAPQKVSARFIFNILQMLAIMVSLIVQEMLVKWRHLAFFMFLQ